MDTKPEPQPNPIWKAAATKAKKYGAVGCLITDLAANGALQPLSLARVGFVVGAGCMWSGSSAQSLDDAMLGELLDKHVYHHPRLGRASVELLNAAPPSREGEHGGRRQETSKLLDLVAFDGARPVTQGLTPMMLNRTILQACHLHALRVALKPSTRDADTSRHTGLATRLSPRRRRLVPP